MMDHKKSSPRAVWPTGVPVTVIEVGLGVLVHENEGRQRILITKRHDRNILGGYWEFPGGKRHADETITQCVVREFAEELGIEVAVTRPLAMIAHDYDHGRAHLHPFLCRWISGEVQVMAAQEARWVEIAKLREFRFPPANESLIAALIKSA